jgi:lipoate-protein ligase A
MMPPLCRLLPFCVAEGAWNMAADETLLAAAVAGVTSFRLYGWSQPTLSLGYFQPSAASRADPHLRQLSWVRRPTGGEALVHHHELTYALALPAGSPWQKHGESWLCHMHHVLGDALASLGVNAHTCEKNEEIKRGEILCFLHHTPGDLRIGDCKIAGSAQRKQRGALLQHGGILLAASPHTPHLPGIQELTGLNLSAKTLGDAIVQQLKKRTGWSITPSEWSAAERQHIEELVQIKYSHPSWNEKR